MEHKRWYADRRTCSWHRVRSLFLPHTERERDWILLDTQREEHGSIEEPNAHSETDIIRHLTPCFFDPRILIGISEQAVCHCVGRGRSKRAFFHRLRKHRPKKRIISVLPRGGCLLRTSRQHQLYYVGQGLMASFDSRRTLYILGELTDNQGTYVLNVGFVSRQRDMTINFSRTSEKKKLGIQGDTPEFAGRGLSHRDRTGATPLINLVQDSRSQASFGWY